MSLTATPPLSPPDESDSGVDTTPLLANRVSRSPQYVRRNPGVRGAFRFLRHARNRRVIHETSMRVWEAAAEFIEQRRSQWAYSKPIVVVDLVWNFAIIVVSVVVLVMSLNNSPSVPLRLWIAGYVFQCILHMVGVYVEYKRRREEQQLDFVDDSPSGQNSGGRWSRSNLNSSSGSGVADSGVIVSEIHQDQTSVAKHLESANTMFTFIWWIIGFYWVSSGGQNLISESPRLYWLCIAFLVFDVFFVVVLVVAAMFIGLAFCFCLPCILTILYALTDQVGATKEDIARLPIYKFRQILELENVEGQFSVRAVMTELNTDTPMELVLPLEDAQCCICLCPYDHGTELRQLPCRHHFHRTCIDKWLYINAVCPLCKFNILKNGVQSSEV